MGTPKGLILLLLVALSTCIFAETQKCKAGCHGSPGTVFQYSEGTTYTYNLEGSTVTSLTGTKGDGVKTKVKATVDLAVHSNCAQFVKISNLRITDNAGKTYDNVKELEKYPLRFNFHDGHIDTEVCAVEGDTQAALNIKRAIISLFQVAPSQTFGRTTHTETDVFGSCPTQFSFGKVGNTLIVNKERNLNRCAHRENFRSDLLTVPYNGASPLQNTPLMASDLKVTQKIENGVLNTAESHETYFYRPLSNRDAGAQTIVETKISLVSSKKQAPANTAVSQHRTIIFEGVHETTVPNNANAIVKAATGAHDHMHTTVGESSARDFSDLIQVLRQSTKEDILKAYGQIQHKKVFIDALFRTGTGEAVEAAVELIKKKDIPENRLKLWALSLSLVRHATPGSLSAVASLIDDKSSAVLYIGAGALAGKYCREHECESKQQYNELIAKLIAPLGNNCKPKDKASENKIIASLKAVHNIHQINDKAADHLVQCSTGSKLPSRIRAFALEAFHGSSCNPKIRKAAIQILKNVEEDSELRIKAYLALVDCPNGEVASVIKELVDKEPSFQVGSFITSHLRNLRASANPDRDDAKAYLGNIKPRKQFPNDLRKFSRNFEVSTLVDLVNVGAAAEANLIYSQDSFVPRSASLNLTTDIFGHSVNFLELGVRAEHVDRALEKVFGPKGFLRSNDWKDMYSGGRDVLGTFIGKINERFSKTTRGKRAVSRDQINALSKKVNLGPEEFDADVDIDLSVKLFGLEAVWKNIHGVPICPGCVIDRMFDCVDGTIDKLKAFDYDLREHLHFMDTELSYPTSLGFPLKLYANGNAALHLQLGGSLDIHSIMKNPQNAQAKLKIVPSAAVEINGQLGIDAYVVKSGLMLTSSLHTATGSDVTVKMLDGSGVDINWGLPVSQQDIVTAKSAIYNFQQIKGHSETHTPLEFNTKRKDYAGCFDQLSPVAGITVCTDVSFPVEGPSLQAALFPLNGPASISIRAKKDDKEMTGYHFRANYNKNTPNKRSLELILDTPGSKSNRKVGVTVEASSSPDYEVKVALDSPWKKLSLQGQIIDNEKSHLLVGKVSSGKTEYSAKVGLDITGSPDSRTYAPIIEYTTASGKKSLTGPEGKNQPVSLEGTVTIEKKGELRKIKFNNVVLHTPAGTYGVDGTGEADKDHIEHNLKLTHDKNTVDVSSKLQKLGPHNYKVHVQAIPAQFPDFSFAVDWDYKRTENQIENNLVVSHGANLKAAESRITLNEKLTYKIESAQNFDVAYNMRVTYPLLGIEGKVDAAATRKNVNYHVFAKYSDKKFESKLDAKRGKELGDYSVDLMGKVNDKGITLKSKRETTSPGKIKWHNLLEFTPDKKYELTSDISYTREPKNLKYLGDHLLKLHQQPDIKLSTGLEYKPGHFSSHCDLTYGDVKCLNSFVKLDRTSAITEGSFKALVENYIEVSGDLKCTGKDGNAAFLVHIPKVQRKVTGKATYSIAGAKHKANAELLWNAEKEPSHKIVIESDSDLTPEDIKSKNSITVIASKIQVDFKRKTKGTRKDGEGESEVEVTLPSGRRFVAYYQRNLHIKSGENAGKGRMSVRFEDHKEGTRRAISGDLDIKSFNKATRDFDAAGTLFYESPSKKSLKATANVQHVSQGDDKWTCQGSASVVGEYLSHPVEAKWKNEVSRSGVNYDVTGKGLTGLEIKVTGKIIADNSPNRHVENTVELKLPFEKLKTLKFKNDWTVSAQDGSPCQIGPKKIMELYDRIKKEKAMKLASTLSQLAPGLVPSCEVKARNELSWNDKTLKLDGALKADLRRGTTKIILTLPNDKPRKLAADWVQNLDADIPKVNGNVNLAWDETKTVQFTVAAEGVKDTKDFTATVSGTSNVNHKHTFEVKLVHKHNDERSHFADVSLTFDEKKLRVVNDLVFHENHRKFDTKVDVNGISNHVLVDLQRRSKKDVTAHIIVDIPALNGIVLDYLAEANTESIEKFKVMAKFSLSIDGKEIAKNYVYDLSAQPGAGDKKQLSFTLKHDKETIASGTTNYEVQNEGNTMTIQGSGNLQVKGESRSTKFVYTKKLLDLEHDKEVGLEHKLDVDAGGKNIFQLVSKDTNRQKKFLEVYCAMDSPKCVRLEFDSKIVKADFAEYEHKTVASYESAFSPTPYSFNLNSNVVRKNRVWDWNADVSFSGAEKVAVSSKVYVHENAAGAVIGLPKRTIEAVASLDFPKNKEGSYKAEVALWLDKQRQPNVKSALVLTGDVSKGKDQFSVTGDARIVNPGIKDLAVNGRVAVGGLENLLAGNLDIDVFQDANQKIQVLGNIASVKIPDGRNLTAVASAKSAGLGLDIQGLGHFAISPNVISTSHFLVLKGSRSIGWYHKLSRDEIISVIKLPQAILFKLKSKLQLTREQQSFDSTIELLGAKPIIAKGEIKDFNSFLASIYKKDEPDKKLVLKGGFAWGQVAEIRANRESANKKDDIFHVTVALDESHFLQTDHGGDYSNFEAVLNNVRKESTAFVNQARIVLSDAVLEANKEVSDISEKVQKAKPDFTPLVNAYQTQIKAIADELANEKLAKQISELLKEFVARATAIFRIITERAQTIAAIFQDLVRKLSDRSKVLFAALSENAAKLSEIFVTRFDQIVQIFARTLSEFVEIIRKHEQDIKKIATIVGQAVQDVGRIVSKAVGQIRHETEEFVKVFMEQLKALPAYEVLKERYAALKEYQIPEQTWSVINEAIEAFIASMPTEELAEFLQSISVYLEKHLKHEKMDDVRELTIIVQNGVKAGKSIAILIRSKINDEDISKILHFTAVPLPGSSWFELPIFSPIHFSPLKWLRSGDLPSISQFYYTYRPTLNPLDWIPPYKSYGLLVNSHNFYTFDRKAFNFQGSCSYILAQDYVDGNFTLIANLEGGKFKSIILSDAKDTFELVDDFSLLVNGKPAEYPVLSGDLSAWRRYDSANIKSRAGVLVSCDSQRQVCQFFVSGFYFGKTRGLLGNLNYEEFDDFTLPSGKITENEIEFGNAWKVAGSCGEPAAAVKENHPLCTSFYADDSTLRSCYKYVSPQPFRQLCQFSAGKAASVDDKKKSACNSAAAYVKACSQEHVRVQLPSSCASCSAGNSPIAIGDTVSIKAPQVKADIIFVVEQIKPNENTFKELIAPLIGALNTDLKTKGLTDVHYSLLGFGAPEQKWPAHFTSGGEMSFEGKSNNIWFGTPSTVEGPYDSVEKKLKWVKHQIDVETGNLRLIHAFQEANSYPFRPEAAKIIIGVMGQPCESSVLPISMMHIRSFLAAFKYRDQGISLHLITPLDDITANGAPATTVVGFDSEKAYTLAAPDGSTELREQLKGETDSCINLSLRTYGLAFSSHNFLAGNADQRKQFVKIASKRLAESVTAGDLKQECKCNIYDGLHPKLNCRVLSREEKNRS